MQSDDFSEHTYTLDASLMTAVLQGCADDGTSLYSYYYIVVAPSKSTVVTQTAIDKHFRTTTWGKVYTYRRVRTCRHHAVNIYIEFHQIKVMHVTHKTRGEVYSPENHRTINQMCS
jgi:hypothetical protein